MLRHNQATKIWDIEYEQLNICTNQLGQIKSSILVQVENLLAPTFTLCILSMSLLFRAISNTIMLLGAIFLSFFTQLFTWLKLSLQGKSHTNKAAVERVSQGCKVQSFLPLIAFHRLFGLMLWIPAKVHTWKVIIEGKVPTWLESIHHISFTFFQS